MSKLEKEAEMSEANAEYPTIIGPDASFKGDLRFEKGVRLLGKFEGQIESKGNLLVAEGAQLSGEVKAGNVRVDGEMTGNMEATGKVQLTATAKLEGDLRTARLEVADGATFVGRVEVGSPRGKSEPKAQSVQSSRPAEKSKQTPQEEPALAGKS